MPIDLGKVFTNQQAVSETIKKFDELEERLLKIAETYDQKVTTTSKKSKTEIIDMSKTVHNLVTEIKEVQKALGGLLEVQKKVDKQKKESAKLTIEELEHLRQLKNAERLDAKVRLSQAGTIENLRAKLAVITLKWSQLTKVYGANSAIVRELGNEKLRLTQILKKVEQATGDARRNVGNYQTALGRLRNSIISVSQAAGVFFGIMGLVRLFKNYIKIIRDFEKTNATLAAVLRQEKSEITALTNESVRLSKITIKTADEIANLQLSYARLGFTQSEILDLTKDTINGSIALNAALDETALLTGAMVKTFDEFDTKDAAEILDIMSLATAKSALNFEKLQKALPIVGGAANAAGLTFTRTTALLSKLADAGIDVSTSATAIRNILIRASKQGMTYNEMLNLVANSSDKLTTAANAMGVRAAVSGTILAANLEGIKELDEAYKEAGGTMEIMAEKQLNTLDGALQLLNSAWEGYILATDEANDVTGTLSGYLRLLAENLTGIIGSVFVLVKAFVIYKAIAMTVSWWNNMLIAEEARLAAALTAAAAASEADAAAKIAEANALGYVTTMTEAATVSTVSMTGATASAAAATNALTLAWSRFVMFLKANWIGVAIAGLYVLYRVIDNLTNKTKEYVAEKSLEEEISERSVELAKEEILELKNLKTQIEFVNAGTEKRGKLISEFNAKYGTHLKNTKDEKDLLEDLNVEYEKIINNIMERARAQAYADKFQTLVSEKLALEELIKKNQEFINQQEKARKADQFAANQTFDPAQLNLAKATQELLLNDLKDLDKEMESTLAKIDGKKEDLGGGGPDPDSKRDKKLEKLVNSYMKRFKAEKQAQIDLLELYATDESDAQEILKKQYTLDMAFFDGTYSEKLIIIKKFEDEGLKITTDAMTKRFNADKKARDEKKKEEIKYNKWKTKQDADAEKQRREDIDKSVKYIGDGIQRLADLRVVESERAVTAQQSAVEIQNQRAVAGLENTLAEQQRLLAKAEQERAIATKRAMQVEKARSLYSAYSGYAKSDSSTALAKTLKDFAILEAITAVAQFEEGGIVKDHPNVKSGVLHGPSHSSRSRGIPILAEGNEGILSVRAMKNLGRDNFQEIMAMAENGRVDEQLFSKQLKQHNTIMIEHGLKEEMIKTRKAIESKKEISAPELVKGMIQITETTRRGSFKTRNNYRIKKPRL